MIRAQEIYMEKYSVDLVKSLTVPSIALRVFRMQYYDDEETPIHLLSFNQDTFIRKGYYGGHVDMYIPHGRDLFFYDVNSLYPTIMRSSKMPCGKAHWTCDLGEDDLDYLFGFVLCYMPKRYGAPFSPLQIF